MHWLYLVQCPHWNLGVGFKGHSSILWIKAHWWHAGGKQGLVKGVYIQWNGIVEWNSGMDYWNDGILHTTYLIIQHVLYSEQWDLYCVLCMQARIHLLIVLIWYVKKEKWQFVIKCETYCGAWLPCMHQQVKVYPGLGQSSKFIQCSTSLASQPSSQQCMQRTQRRAHCSLYNTCWMIRYVLWSIPPFQ